MTEHTGGAAPDWTAVVAAAVRAPSIHNTQPWTFTASPDGLELRLDRERALPVLDPTSRQQVISCGAALEFAVVALAAAGPADAAAAGLLRRRGRRTGQRPAPGGRGPAPAGELRCRVRGRRAGRSPGGARRGRSAVR